MPSLVLGAEGNYEAMLLTYIDPRFPEPTIKYMQSRNMIGKYSQFTFAGASIGVVAPKFKTCGRRRFGTISPPRSSCTIFRKRSR